MDGLSDELLAILHCPACLRQQLDSGEPRQAPLTCEGETLHCARCGRRYALRDGWLPDLVVDGPAPE